MLARCPERFTRGRAAVSVGFGLGGGEGLVDAVFGDEAVDDVEDGVAVVGVEGVELVDAVGDGCVGGGEWVSGCVVEE